MAGIIRIRAIEVLVDLLEKQCPELMGRIHAGAVEHPHRQSSPCLVVSPTDAYEFHPDQDGNIVYAPEGGTTAVFKVGRHEAVIQLRLLTKTSRERYRFEDRLSQLFIGSRHRPGVVVVTIPDCWNAVIAYELEETMWKNEFAFDKEWFSILEVTMQIPALVERGGMYDIEDLRSCFTEDVDSDFADIPSTVIDCVQVAADGTITAASQTP